MKPQKSNNTAKSGAREFFINAMTRQLSSMFPGFFGSDTKHTKLYADYGYKENLTFTDFYMMWKRNGYARAGVNHAVETCWQENPELTIGEDTHDQTPAEKQIAKELERLMFWSQLAEADKYSRIGEYAGVIFRFRDGLMPDQPVTRVAGLEGIAEIIPALQGQLTVVETFSDPSQENYGQVKMYQYTEANTVVKNSTQTANRQFNVHPDRVHIWSRNSTVYGGESVLEGGFNDLITIQKVIGAGGEGFWKNSKAAPIMNVDPATNLTKLAAMLGVPPDQIGDKIDEVVGDFQTGMDKSMLLQGIDVKTLEVTLPLPKEYVLVAAQSFAASINEPLKLLVGNQNGERASTEDNKQWNKTCASRRTNYCKPNIMRIIERFVNIGVLPKQDWYLLWPDLTESTTLEKAEVVTKMADINQKMLGSGEQVFTADEMRETMGWEGSATPVTPKRDPNIDNPKPTEK